MNSMKMLAPWLKKLVDDALYEFAWKKMSEKTIQPGIVLKVVPKDTSYELGSFYQVEIPEDLKNEIKGRAFLVIEKNISRPK